jgi:hypothetical protein
MQDKIVRKVGLSGIRAIMFDRYAGSNNEELEPKNKMYLGQDGKSLVMPASNLQSFLSSQTNESAPQRILGKKWKTVAKAALSFVDINPLDIPFMRNGQPIDKDDSSIYIDFRVARMKKGPLVIPNPKHRPVLPLPWELQFELTLWKNADLTESVLKRLFEEGGVCLGLGTFRGLFGKFEITKWE